MNSGNRMCWSVAAGMVVFVWAGAVFLSLQLGLGYLAAWLFFGVPAAVLTMAFTYGVSDE